ncbi:DUF4179 domain-containing protein [Viridibacillus sp. YIM B01967]|uniref:DUF4179 domain-containing protein n=1 Tax=Viridibacillus soli TaxID=2798301 RepID=A0ABS1H697_9BACL|nr:DUF4179 domain-containing protein [Viridibacillus soli]MBK3494926.1 DUF4179 domain-containing protein [Viridibacillus soli]
MNKQSPDIKKVIDDMKVPTEKLNRTIEMAMKRGEASRKIRKSKWKPIVGAAVTAGCLFVGSAFVSPAMAKVLSSIPLIGSIFESTGDKGLKKATDQGLSNTVNITSTDQDITLTIQDVFYDGTRFSISYLQSDQQTLGELDLKVNGKRINFGDGRQGEKLTNGQYAGILNIKTLEALPKSFDLSMDLKMIGETTGNWHFDVPVTKSKAKVKEIVVNKTGIINDTKYKVKSIQIGPAGVKAKIDIFTEKIEEKVLEFEFYLLDDHGIPLETIQDSGSGDNNVMHMEYLFAPLEKEVSTLTFSPFYIKMPVDGEPSEKPLNEKQLPITLNQGKMGNIVVTDLKKENSKMHLYFEAQSDFPYGAHFDYNRIWVEDAKGNDLTSDITERISGNRYVKTFDLPDEDGNLTVKAVQMPFMELKKEAQVKVPLK